MRHLHCEVLGVLAEVGEALPAQPGAHTGPGPGGVRGPGEVQGAKGGLSTWSTGGSWRAPPAGPPCPGPRRWPARRGWRRGAGRGAGAPGAGPPAQGGPWRIPASESPWSHGSMGITIRARWSQVTGLVSGHRSQAWYLVTGHRPGIWSQDTGLVSGHRSQGLGSGTTEMLSSGHQSPEIGRYSCSKIFFRSNIGQISYSLGICSISSSCRISLQLQHTSKYRYYRDRSDGCQRPDLVYSPCIVGRIQFKVQNTVQMSEYSLDYRVCKFTMEPRRHGIAGIRIHDSHGSSNPP